MATLRNENLVEEKAARLDPGRGRRISYDLLMDATRDRLRRGAALFEAGRFFEAHEVWEEEWLEKSGDERLALQGLIQLAAALYKGSRGDGPEGCIRLLEAALSKIRGGAAELDGLRLAPFERRAERALEAARRRLSSVAGR